MPTPTYPIQHVMPGDIVIWEKSLLHSQDTGGYPYGHSAIVFGTYREYFSRDGNLVPSPAIAILDAITPGKTKKNR